MSAGGVNIGTFGALEFQTNAAASLYSKGPFANQPPQKGSAQNNNRKRIDPNTGFLPGSNSPSDRGSSQRYPDNSANRNRNQRVELSSLPIFKLLRAFNLQQYTRVRKIN